MTCRLKTKEKSLYEQIGGLEGLVGLLIDSSSYPMNLISFPYNVIEYRSILKKASNLSELYYQHVNASLNSRAFSFFSPNYKMVRKHLMLAHEIL